MISEEVQMTPGAGEARAEEGRSEATRVAGGKVGKVGREVCTLKLSCPTIEFIMMCVRVDRGRIKRHKVL